MKTHRRLPEHGFTLVEVMVSTVIVVILAGILISAIDMTAKSFARTSSKIEQFSESRRGFETMTRRLAEATLNTYWGYPEGVDAGTNVKKQNYTRNSDLRFVSGPMKDIAPEGGFDRPTHGVFFQAPIGEAEDRETYGVLSETLNCWGYFLEIADDKEFIPQILKDLVKPRRRSRLIEFRQPTEENPIFWPPNTTTPVELQSPGDRNWWFIKGINQTTDRPVRVVAENVIAMIVVPRLPRKEEVVRETLVGSGSDASVLCPLYSYDSGTLTSHKPALSAKDRPEEVNPKNQLPPVVQVVMVALDENSGARLDSLEPATPGFGLDLDSIFQRSVNLEDDRSTSKPGDGELSKLETQLVDRKLIYRIFNTDVIIRGAKWSRSQAN